MGDGVKADCRALGAGSYLFKVGCEGVCRGTWDARTTLGYPKPFRVTHQGNVSRQLHARACRDGRTFRGQRGDP